MAASYETIVSPDRAIKNQQTQRAKLLYQADQTRELKVTITLLYYVNRRVKVVVSTRHSTSVMVQVNELKPPSTHWHSPVSFLL
ncbi:hypothetical protein RRG08_002067 [Elysia crispata]|uniref:Uncharacterized protein n=1 Tax=Elysia crispata TaxID=231223 RepID=A0AAE0ZKP3_9GAST|nr:hypothetical protein RRG08_002067 [Elysia crispata]